MTLKKKTRDSHHPAQEALISQAPLEDPVSVPGLSTSWVFAWYSLDS